MVPGAEGVERENRSYVTDCLNTGRLWQHKFYFKDVREVEGGSEAVREGELDLF